MKYTAFFSFFLFLYLSATRQEQIELARLEAGREIEVPCDSLALLDAQYAEITNGLNAGCMSLATFERLLLIRCARVVLLERVYKRRSVASDELRRILENPFLDEYPIIKNVARHLKCRIDPHARETTDLLRVIKDDSGAAVYTRAAAAIEYDDRRGR